MNQIWQRVTATHHDPTLNYCNSQLPGEEEDDDRRCSTAPEPTVSGSIILLSLPAGSAAPNSIALPRIITPGVRSVMQLIWPEAWGSEYLK